MARLGDLIEQIRGVSYKPEDIYDELNENSIALLRANNIKDGQLNFDDVIYVDKKRVRDNQLLKTGDILICTSSGSKELVGKAAYIQEDLPMTFGAFCKVVRPQKICSDYLGHFFNSPNYRKKISNASAGANINNIRNEHIDELEILLPTIDRQEYVAVVLGKLSNLISLRKQQLAKLDELVKARFVEMFGEYPSNQMGWTTCTIRDIVEDIRYGTSRPAVDGGVYPYLRMNNITYSGELDLSDIKRIDIPENELPRCTVKRGDVLFNRTNSKELVGKTCVYDKDEMMVLAGFIIRVRVNERILPEFLSSFLNADFSKQMLLGMCKAAIGQANINAQELQGIELYLPPIVLQREFVDFKTEVSRQKLTIQQSLDKLEMLKKSLMQEYFG